MKFKYLNKKETAIKITQEDAFLRSISRSDLELRLDSNSKSYEDFIILLKESAMDWRDEEIEKAKKCTHNAILKISKYSFLLPCEIKILKTSGNEEFGSAYCRGLNLMVLHEKALLRNIDSLTRLIIHELFHLISRNNEELREALFNIIGFKKGPTLVLDEKIDHNRITNPDATDMQFYFPGKINGKDEILYPILIRNNKKENKIFDLKYISINGHDCFDENEIANLYECIGNNTDYIIHPEEIIAEKFTILVCNEEIKSEGIIFEMRKKLDQYVSHRIDHKVLSPSMATANILCNDGATSDNKG